MTQIGEILIILATVYILGHVGDWLNNPAFGGSENIFSQEISWSLGIWGSGVGDGSSVPVFAPFSRTRV